MQCQKCEEDFDPVKTPSCPACLAQMWLRSTEFIRPKHDPRKLPLVWEGYRSVLSPDFASHLARYLEFAARHGTWYFDRHYGMYVHLTHEPLGHSPGGGVPAGSSSPEHALDSLIIAEANSPQESHGFAVNLSQFESQIEAGEFVTLALCSCPGCSHLCVPGRTSCIRHE